MIRYYFTFFLLLYSFILQAQDSPAYMEAKKLYAEKKYDQAIDKFKKAIDELSEARNYTEVKTAISYLDVCYNNAGKNYFDRSMNYDSTSASNELFFNIISVEEKGGDSVELIIDKGANAGIFEGAKGYVMLSYYTDREKTPNNDFVANARVVKVTNQFARINAVFYDKLNPSKKKLAKGDQLVLKLYPLQNKPANIFYDLASLNIVFKDSERDTLMTQLFLLNNPSAEMENRIMDYFLWDTRRFYTTYLADKTDSTFNTIYRTGRFKGQTMKDAFRYAEKEDIYAFLEFVKTFPGKYIGKMWQLNETYATWVLNNVPPPEKGQNWLLRFVKETPLSKIDSFASKFSWYIINDSLSGYRNLLNDISDNQEALSLYNKFYRIAQILNDKKAQLEFVYYRSYLYQRMDDTPNAMRDAKAAYALNSHSSDIVSNVAYLYAKQEKYDSCFMLLDPLVKANPDRYDIAGNLGWYKILAGKMDEAVTLCKKAYENESGSYSYAVNYGHTFLLKGRADSARVYYAKSLENLYNPTDYADGPKKDFELFFTKGWHRKDAAEALDWMEEQFNNKYSYITKGNVVWDTAKKLYDAKKYRLAADKWKQYIEVFKGMKEPPLSSIHNAYGWIGVSYEEGKNYKQAEEYYFKSLQMALDTPALSDKLVNDYSLLYYFYKNTGNNIKATEYKLLYDVEQQKRDDLLTKPRLYVVAIEGKNSLQPESKENARLFFQAIDTTVKKSFVSTIPVYLDNKSLSRQKVLSALDTIKKYSRPEDVLLFYYTGSVIDKNKEHYYLLKDDTSANNMLSEDELVNTIKDINSRKKLLISDVPSPGVMSKLAENYSAVSYGLNEVIFICPGVLTPVNSKTGTSAFTEQLVESVKELSAKEKFTAKDLVGMTSAKLGSGKYYIPALSFAYAKDFVLFKNGQSSRGEEVTVTTRSTIVDESPSQTAGTTVDISADGRNYALLFATNTYDEFKSLSNAVYDAKDVAKTLKEDYGFETNLLVDGTKDDVEDKLIEYRDSKIYGPNDQLFIYFAGHGIYNDNENMGYLVSKDSKKTDLKRKSYLSYSDLFNKYLKNIKCKRIFLVLDACYAGTFFDQAGDRGDSPKPDVMDWLKKKAMGKNYHGGISSGSKEPVSDGLPGQHSPFAASFLNTLIKYSSSNNFVTAGMIIESMKSNLPATTLVRGGTFGINEPGGQFIFELKTAPATTPVIKSDSLKQ
ncbi:MAG: hypothetical protein EKK37_10630 [Sphingobacteriales bacterium]|nr:MAG: hypothetical protein EKK37_10630 [Sphingobacteriales bacterium]